MAVDQGIDFGIFQPGEATVINGVEFVRDEYRSHRGRIAVWDLNLNDEAPIGYMPSGFTTEDAALAWLAGYATGHKAGEGRGRADLQRQLRDLLAVQ